MLRDSAALHCPAACADCSLLLLLLPTHCVPQVMHVIDTVLLPTQLFKGEKLTAKVMERRGMVPGMGNWEGQMSPGGGDVFDLTSTAG